MHREVSVLPSFAMEAELDPEQQQQMMMEGGFSRTMQIDPRRARFPCSIVWSPLPVISWFIPFIGHIGICREDGVILDFAGPNFVCVDNFAFGAATRYFQITNEKVCAILFYSFFVGEQHRKGLFPLSKHIYYSGKRKSRIHWDKLRDR